MTEKCRIGRTSREGWVFLGAITVVLMMITGIGSSLTMRWYISRQAKVAARPDQPRVTKELTRSLVSVTQIMTAWTHQVQAGEDLASIVSNHLDRTGLSSDRFEDTYRCARALNEDKLDNGFLAEGSIVLVPFKTGLSEAELKAKACPHDAPRIVESRVDVELVPNSKKSATADDAEEGPTVIRADVFRAYHQVQKGDTPWDLTKTHCNDISSNQRLWATDQVQAAVGIVDARRIPIGTELPYYEVPWKEKPVSLAKHCEHDSFWRAHIVNGKELWREKLK